MKSHRERLLIHRYQTPYAEVDLLMESEGTGWVQSLNPKNCGRNFLSSKKLTMIEVKTLSNWDLWARPPIGKMQFRRLCNARLFLEDKYSRPVQLILATVEGERGSTIKYFDDWPIS